MGKGLTKDEREIRDGYANNKKILYEYRRLLKYYESADPARLEVAKRLIINAAFMGVTLGELGAKIGENGVSAPYQNGVNQSGDKATPEVQVYNTMIKNYSNVIKQLDGLLAPSKSGDGDDFDDF